jgi:ABC-type multidrug transport system ATPase subunit
MGSSGAGKTSLLNALSDRIKQDQSKKLTGERVVNGSTPLTGELYGKFGGYVMQDDVIFEYFTVLEALTFAARLRLNIPIEEQDKRVEKLLKDLGIWHVKDTLVGST